MKQLGKAGREKGELENGGGSWEGVKKETVVLGPTLLENDARIPFSQALFSRRIILHTLCVSALFSFRCFWFWFCLLSRVAAFMGRGGHSKITRSDFKGTRHSHSVFDGLGGVNGFKLFGTTPPYVDLRKSPGHTSMASEVSFQKTVSDAP